MEKILNTDLLKSVLAKNIGVKDTLDYALFGISEPNFLHQFLLLGPIFSGLRTKRYFTGITTSGILLVEVTRKFKEKSHAFYKYYEVEDATDRRVLKGIELNLKFQRGKTLKIVFPRIVLGLPVHIEDAEASIRVIHEKIRASKEYFRKQRSQSTTEMDSKNPQQGFKDGFGKKQKKGKRRGFKKKRRYNII